MSGVEQALESTMRWVAEEPVPVAASVQVAYEQALQMERIADSLERIANAMEEARS